MDTNLVIGVLGGMGSYATINLFQQYAEIFPAEKEWDRPRIVIDNRCTMPSRVRAFLYSENVDQLVNEMTDSMRYLVKTGCNRILLACNTSHLFLPMIYDKVPKLRNKVVDIIIECANKLREDGTKEIYLLATEGTIDSQIYQRLLQKEQIVCCAPASDEYHLIRKCIEAVKQNKYSDEVKEIFLKLINRHDICVLACTELPILYELYKDEVTCSKVYDPLSIALNKIHDEFIKK